MIDRYSRPAMRAIWTEENKFNAYLKVEILAAEAWRELGVVPAADVAPLTEVLSLPVREWLGRLANDFEPGIFKAAPQIKAVRDTLLSMGAVYAAMSGSGAAVFGLFDSPVDDLALKTRLYNCDRFTCRLKN